MEIVFDEAKRLSNIEKHGLDFVDLDVEFFAASIVRPAKEGRAMAAGAFGETIITVMGDLDHLDALRQSQGKGRLMTAKFDKNRPLTDQEETEVLAKIASDPDAPEATDEQIAQSTPFAEAFPELMQSIRRSRGRPRLESPKEAVTLRLSPQTIRRFQASGEDWRAKMSEVLEKAVR